jgi:hypothetical protein
MNLLKIYSEWNELAFWNQMGVAVGLISLILTIAALGGMQMQLINLALVFLFFGYFCLVYGNIQQSRKLVNARDDLGKVDSRINQAVQAVYNHKGEEINELKTEIATWKDKASNFRDQSAFLEQELTQCKGYCEFLFDKRNELKTDLDNCESRLNRIYESDPSLNPTRTRELQASILLRPSTPDDDRLGEIHRWLHGS